MSVLAAQTPAKPIQLALQGGGAHGAFAWGVLDRLLEDPRLDIRAVSGTSAGAMNGVVLADGLLRGGRDGGRQALEAFWRSVAAAGALSPFRRGIWDRISGRHSLDRSAGYIAFDLLGRLLSPRDINPLGIDPLRPLLQHVDFERLNGPDAIRLLVAATNVRTGLPRVFGPGELSVDAVLASARLPQLMRPVEIDGESYWDGGFSANPALLPLVETPAAPDIVIVALNPLRRHDVPSGARDIINRTNEITFNASLLGQLEGIRNAERAANRRGGAPIRLHLIRCDGDGGEALAASSKLDVEWASLKARFERGRRGAEAWLAENADALGARGTLDLDAVLGAAAGSPAVAAPQPRPARGLRALWRRLRAAA
jgi:NTE family protein